MALFQHPDREIADQYQKLIVSAADAPEPTPCQVNPEPYSGPWAGRPGASSESAENLCIDCPLMVQCGNYAKAAREPYGVWGGTLPRDRGIPDNYRA